MAAGPSSAAPVERPWPDRVAVGLLAVVSMVAAFTFRDYGLGWDDFTHAQYGELLLSLYTSGLQDTRALSFVNLYLYGGGFDLASAIAAKISPFELFETRRLVAAVIGLSGLVVTWRIGRRVGGPLAGLVALVLLATCPLYFGHMFINPKDAPFAVAMALFLLGLVRAIDEYPKLSIATTLILGVGFGLSIGSRVMAGFGVLAALAAVGLLVALDSDNNGWRSASKRLGTFILALLPAAVVAYAVMALVWPWAVIDPLNPLRAIGYFSHFFEKPWQELFEGRLIQPPDMPRSYLPVLLSLQLPEMFLALGGLGAVGVLIATMRRAVEPRRRAVLLAVALSALLPIVTTIVTRPAMYNGIRHFVFVLPPLAVAGGLCASVAVNYLQRFGRTALAVATALFAFGISLPVIAMVRLHPYEYVDFNEIAGGVRSAQSRFMLDYWGLAFKEASENLRARLAERGEKPPARRRWKIAICGPHPPAAHALGDAFEPTWNPNGADFALMLGTFYCAKLDAPVMAEIVREDVVFARAYDLRGRTVRRMFSVPPVTQDEQR